MTKNDIITKFLNNNGIFNRIRYEIDTIEIDAGFLYVIQSGDLCKLGITIHGDGRRLGNYQTHNPSITRFDYFQKFNNYQKLERVLHEKLQSHHISGEWFRLSSEDIILIIEDYVFSDFGEKQFDPDIYSDDDIKNMSRMIGHVI